jgi:predicted alpha-1,6-mannanase (GH76 family)
MSHSPIRSSLSALLAETTGDDIYLEAAKESADFISNHLLNAQHVVQDGISVRANDSCALNSEVNQESYNSGLMIEGLAILYSITTNSSILDT